VRAVPSDSVEVRRVCGRRRALRRHTRHDGARDDEHGHDHGADERFAERGGSAEMMCHVERGD
jgi:hypothetical protein